MQPIKNVFLGQRNRIVGRVLCLHTANPWFNPQHPLSSFRLIKSDPCAQIMFDHCLKCPPTPIKMSYLEVSQMTYCKKITPRREIIFSILLARFTVMIDTGEIIFIEKPGDSILNPVYTILPLKALAQSL